MAVFTSVLHLSGNKILQQETLQQESLAMQMHYLDRSLGTMVKQDVKYRSIPATVSSAPVAVCAWDPLRGPA
jgi:hypothetical protein